jgi:quercetin dioxygenase-like cupin family protein
VLFFKAGLNLLENNMVKMNEIFPEFIQHFPKVKLPAGLTGPSTFLDAQEGQVAFHSLAEGQTVPLHSHDHSWAVLISGKLEYTVGSEQFIVVPGQSWYIPGATLHGGTAMEDSCLLEVFCEKRWTPAE